MHKSIYPGGNMSVVDKLKFYYFHHHHYSQMPEDTSEIKSVWVNYPNSNYDPAVGHTLYNRHMRTIRLADQLGFDGITINEHHNTVYSMTPAVSLMAAAIISQTKNVKIQVAGVPINLAQPNRVAEEYGMLDVMSGGRMEFAFPLGTGMEYWANSGAINPVTSRERFRESLDIIKRCWTEPGPFSYDGDFYRYRYLNPFPLPLQKPHPKMFIVGSGSPSTVALASDFGAGYSIVFTPIPQQLEAFDKFRELTVAKGNTPDSDDIIIIANVYVSDTDAKARAEVKEYQARFWSWFHRVPPKFLLPPGYVTNSEFLRRVSDAALAHGTEATDEDMALISRQAFGSPQTVADILCRWAEEAGCSRFNLVLEHADMPEWMTVKNMTMFCEEVIPLIRKKGIEASVRGKQQPVSVGE